MLYVRYPLSLRNVEDLLFERGFMISVTRLCGFGGNASGRCLQLGSHMRLVNHMRGVKHWRWHLDEMYVKMNGEMVYLWRAVDHEDDVLESHVAKKRDKSASLAIMDNLVDLSMALLTELGRVDIRFQP